tara:strand:- start:180 stop:443 length:264 start_codon:yes stop_codon:yes gene_type:complete
MKKLFLSILVLGLILVGNAYSMDEDDLAELASKAETDHGARAIYNYCEGEDYKRFTWLYGDDCKCAIKAAKSKNETGVRLTLEACGL